MWQVRHIDPRKRDMKLSSIKCKKKNKDSAEETHTKKTFIFCKGYGEYFQLKKCIKEVWKV